ncbi:MAG TPA: OsmC family protein [Actinomycetota bacterium]|nr:OsmC family protein [Actinomycetota bacterium]
MAVTRSATTIWKGTLFEGEGKFTTGTGALGEQPVSWPARTEEPGGKTSPEELIAAAHASCLSMAFSGALTRNGTPPEELRVTATATFEKREEGFRITRMLLEVEGQVPGIDEATFQEKAEAAKVGCPVSNALKGNVEIDLTAKLL